MHQNSAPLDVLEEFQPQTLALTSPGDQAGDIGHSEDDVVDTHHTEVGHQRGEGVVSDLRSRRRQRGDQTRLTGTGETHESDIGNGLQFEDDIARLSGFTEQREAGGLTPRRRKGGVAQPTAAPACDDESLPIAHQICEHFTVAGSDDGSARYSKDDILGLGAVAVRALARPAACSLAVRMPMKVQQGRYRRIDHSDDVATPTAVAAIGTT